MKQILNLGCGNDTYGNVRMDFIDIPNVTDVNDLEEGIPYPENYFDEIRCWRILEHIKDIGWFIEEIERVLKKGGRLDLITDNASYIFYYIKPKSEHNKWNDKERRNIKDNHYHLFVESHLRRLLSGFNIKEVNYLKFNRHPFWKKMIFYTLPFKLGYSEIQIIGVKK